MKNFSFSGSYTDFIQKVFKLDGEHWRFSHRPYIYAIINNNKFKRTLMKTARQVEKSTTMAGRTLAKACLHSNQSYLYVAPTFKQTGVFSRKKIDEVFETSPLLRKNYYPGVKGFRIEEKKLKNNTTLYFRSAYHNADSIRGLTSGGTDFDEIQDMLPEIFPVVEACSQKKLQAQFYYAGTPKTFDNIIHQKWEQSTQNIWHIKCMHCGYWNELGIENVLLDKPGIWCRKCQKEVYSELGCWVSGHSENEMAGFEMPYIILHKDYIDWKDLFFKMRNYDTGVLMNEVFGKSYDNGSKPLSREQMIAACNPNRSMFSCLPQEIAGTDIYAGIDWGGGKTGFSILTLGYFDTLTNKFKIIFCKRFIGREAEPENLVHILAKILIDFNAKIVGADFGFGFGLNDRLKKLLPSNFVYVTYRHSIIKKFVAYDEMGNTYVTNRTEVMTDYFNAIKQQKIEAFKWSEFEDFGKDYLNINSEYSDRLRQMRYIHSQPDDAFHSGLYARLSWMIRTKQVPSTRLEPGDSDIDAIVNESD